MIDSLVSEKKKTLRVAAELAEDTVFILKCAGDAQEKIINLSRQELQPEQPGKANKFCVALPRLDASSFPAHSQFGSNNTN
jgi:hypothetical protein